MNVIKEVNNLNLPKGQYVVFGSAPMAIYGIREVNDIDLFVTKELYEKLSKLSDWTENTFENGNKYLKNGVFEVFDNWDFGNYNPSLDDLIDRSETINGVSIVSLQDVLNWKKALGRPKDLQDIKLIKEYLDS